mgnify:FL=1
MASLTAQMEALQQQQSILAEKIKEEEEKKRQEGLTIEHLENLNSQQKENIFKYKSKDGKYRGKFELQQANLMTKPRFDVILGILKTQDARIRELEGIIKKLNKPKKLGLGPHADADWNYA